MSAPRDELRSVVAVLSATGLRQVAERSGVKYERLVDWALDGASLGPLELAEVAIAVGLPVPLPERERRER